MRFFRLRKALRGFLFMPLFLGTLTMPILAREDLDDSSGQTITFDPQDEVNSIDPDSLETQVFENQQQPDNGLLYENSSLDDRILVENTSLFPYSAICQLDLIFEQNGIPQLFEGTGFLISETDLLTCAHCVYDLDFGMGAVKRLRVRPGANGEQSPFGILDSRDGQVDMISVLDGYVESGGQEENDLAIIHLNQPVGRQTGYIRLSTGGPLSSRLWTSGYPSYGPGNVWNTGQAYRSLGSLAGVRGRAMEFYLFGTGGQSGSPVFNDSNEAVSLFGYGYEDGYLQGGAMMDSARIDFIARNSSMEAPVYRAYNPNSGEHFYTTSYQELRSIERAGWKDEGLAWRSAPAKTSFPVYRLYNPNAGDHHYTTDANEQQVLASLGWKKEGISWYAPAGEFYSPIYRLYNPNQKSGQHHFTMDAEEAGMLIGLGWKDEGQPFNTR